MITPPAIDLSTITDAPTLKAYIAQALRTAGQPEQAALWERETAQNDSMNGLHIKLKQFVTVAPWPPAPE